MSKKLPPLIQQFVDIQLTYPEAIVATEVGGFFEIWQLHDQPIGHAIKASQLLDTVLTRRNKSDPESPLMTGFPNHVGEEYFKRLVQLGQTVVVVEQQIHGRKADGNKQVTREVTQILSPGIVFDQLKDSQNNFFASVFKSGEIFGVCLLDVSTGEVKISESSFEDFKDTIYKFSPKELLISTDKEINMNFGNIIIHENKNLIKKTSHAGKVIGELYNIENPTGNDSYPLVSIGLEFFKQGSLALANLINYLSSTEYNKLLLKKISKPEILHQSDFLHIPFNSFLSLEAFESHSQKDSDFTLIKSLDKCKTSMGKRKLVQWIKQPLKNKNQIESRHEKVEKLIEDSKFFPELKDVYDLNRLSRKLIFGRLMPHEISHLYQSLNIINDILKEEKSNLLIYSEKAKKHLQENIDIPIASVASNNSDFEFFLGDLKKQVSKEEEKWKVAQENLLSYVEYLKKELGTEKLRLVEKSESFFLLAPKGIKSFADEAGIKIQIKSNDVNIIDPKFESLSAQCFGLRQSFRVKAKNEFDKFQKEFHENFGEKILEIADLIAQIDVLSCFAEVSKERGYVKPILIDNSKPTINLINMRHPVVEIAPSLNEKYVPNDISFNEKTRTLVIYGANSSGKSTILKAVALNIIMSQIGCFIPSSQGSELSIFETIQTRITSFDSLSEGLSTFTQEMTELSLALKNYNKHSLFLFDEIGRGTSVEDGEAIAFGTLNFLNKEENKSLTLFATHYHELYEQIKNLPSIEVKNLLCYRSPSGDLIFSRKLEEGRGNGSYGIEVAKSCGIPEEIIRSAQKYATDFAPLKVSRYNKKISGTICPICQSNPVQETHHIIEQKQGKVEVIENEGALKSIHHASNLIMICSSCHEKITRKEIEVEVVQGIKGKVYNIIKKN